MSNGFICKRKEKTRRLKEGIRKNEKEEED
jgi:hypothetical protein